jgi:hypothetical protein
MSKLTPEERRALQQALAVMDRDEVAAYTKESRKIIYALLDRSSADPPVAELPY